MTIEYSPIMRLPGEVNKIFTNLEADLIHTIERFLSAVPDRTLMWKENPIVFEHSNVHCIGLQITSNYKVEVIVRESDQKMEPEKDFLGDQELTNVIDLRNLFDKVYKAINDL